MAGDGKDSSRPPRHHNIPISLSNWTFTIHLDFIMWCTVYTFIQQAKRMQSDCWQWQRERYPTLTLLTLHSYSPLKSPICRRKCTDVSIMKRLDSTKFMRRGILAMAHDKGEMNIVHCSGAGQSWLHWGWMQLGHWPMVNLCCECIGKVKAHCSEMRRCIAMFVALQAHAS